MTNKINNSSYEHVTDILVYLFVCLLLADGEVLSSCSGDIDKSTSSFNTKVTTNSIAVDLFIKVCCF